MQLVLVLLLVLGCGMAQSPSEETSLADLAKKTRAMKASKDHVSARKVLNNENAPSANCVKRTTGFWATIPPAKLTVVVPVVNHTGYGSIEIPLEHNSVFIRFGEPIWSTSFADATQQYLGMLLTNYFRGAVLKLGAVENTSVGSQRAMLVHFSFDFRGIGILHKGMALLVSAPEQVLSVGCMYRSTDWEQAEPICEEAINSAEVEIPTEYKSVNKPY